MAEHCSADKLMQQSRLSQQHTPTLAHCLWFLRACTRETGSGVLDKHKFGGWSETRRVRGITGGEQPTGTVLGAESGAAPRAQTDPPG